ncbi:MAG: SDR family oxidoreductase [Gemmatimonadetes bacterium]|nr:SDR family oxidoreductase [Gemmatimonadota bacterium]NNM05610.1 SDR family oxidoreductase [Gemmatimonadota bacterium]
MPNNDPSGGETFVAKRFDGKAALITGGSKRLGRETALALGRAGARLAIHYNSSKEPAEALCEELKGMGTDAYPIQADLGDKGETATLFEKAWDRMGRMDFLVNNASIFPSGRLDQMGLQDVHENLQVNAWAPFVLTRAFWRRLKGTQDRGSVVNLLDTRLVGGDLAHAAYHLSKVALSELTTLTALEFAPELQVNGVAPGAVMPPEEFSDDYLDSLTVDLPLKRRGYPRDISDATLYLLGASFVTGQVIFVDGGRHIRLGGNT